MGGKQEINGNQQHLDRMKYHDMRSDAVSHECRELASLLQDSASTGSLPYFGGSLTEINESTKIGLIGAYWSK